MTFVLGVTGGIGSGKTTVTDRFATHGITIVDADVIARNIVSPGSDVLYKIIEHFGDDLLIHGDDIEGIKRDELNREKLRKIVFDKPDEKQWLENFLHPLIRKKIKSDLQQKHNGNYIILSAPLLLDTDLHTITDRVLVIDCDEDIQVMRAGNRDNNRLDEIKKIMDKQISRIERNQKADDIIINNGTVDELYKAVDKYHQQLTEILNTA